MISRIVFHFIGTQSLLVRRSFSNHSYLELANNSQISTLFQLNKNFTPIVLPNLKHLDLNHLEDNDELRNCNVDFIRIKKLVVDIEQIDKELLVLFKIKDSLTERYKEHSIDLDEARNNRTKVKSLKSVKTSLQDELTQILLSIPNIGGHKPNESWLSIPEREKTRDTANAIVIKYADFCNNVISKSLNGIPLQFVNGNLALCKYMLMEDAYDWWLRSGCIPIALSDICKTAIVECCAASIFAGNIALLDSTRHGGKDDENNPHNVLFLKGSGSLEAFSSYLMRTRVGNKSLPIRLVTLGNRYRLPQHTEAPIHQSSVISALLATATADALDEQTELLLAALKKFWVDRFNIRLRVGVVQRRSDLHRWEGLRYEIATDQRDQSVVLASVSVIGDYISRRLMINDHDDNPLHMVYAELLNFDSLLEAVKANQEDISYACDLEWMDPVGE